MSMSSACVGDKQVLSRADKLLLRAKGDACLSVIMCLVPGSPIVGEHLVQSSIGLRQVEGPDEVHVPFVQCYK